MNSFQHSIDRFFRWIDKENLSTVNFEEMYSSKLMVKKKQISVPIHVKSPP